ncbi:MAG: hypothetical protein ABEN55_21905 [Bradymonadaceae bacterium]
MFWSVLLGALAIVGLLVPVDWNPVVGSEGLVNRPEPLNAFSERVVAIDRSLQNNETVEVEANRAFEIHLYLGARRLVRAGEMSHDDMRRARDLLREMHAQLRREQTEGAREAVRAMWLDRLVEEIPRLDRKKVDEELETLHRQIKAYLMTEGG